MEDGFSEMYVKMFWMKTVALTKNDVTAFPDAVAAFDAVLKDCQLKNAAVHSHF